MTERKIPPYTYPPEEYAKQLRAYYELEKLSFSREDGKEAVLAALEERSAKKRGIADVANTMIREYIETFEKSPEAMSAGDAELLERFFDSLVDRKTRKIPDLGVTLRIARLLKDYYARSGDLQRRLRALDDCVSIEVRLFANHSNSFSGSEFIEECLALTERLGEIPPESRTAFFVTLYRLCCCHEKGCAESGTPGPMALLLRIDEFLHRYVSNDDPTFREALATQGIAYNIVLIFLAHCVWENQNGREPELDGCRPIVEHCAAVLREQLDRDDPIFYAARPSIESYLLRADFHLGKLTAPELLDGLSAMQASAAENENPVVQASRLAQLNYYYLLYLLRFSGYDKQTITELSRRRIRETLPRILRITREINDPNFNLYLLLFMAGASYTSSFEEFAGIILEMTVYSDKALFIHTTMVRELSLAIFDRLIETSPEFFDGVAGRGAAYIRAHPEEMKELLSDCCMFHDIGKFFMLDIVENSMRRLTDDEFRLIQSHPAAFEDIYENWAFGDERFLCIHDCALTHHLWHDGTHGYPRVAQTKNRPFADILAIADSLDAATDFLGRPYNSGKTIDELIAEFQAGAGTRYGPEAAAALSDPALRDRLQYLITDGRREVYYRICAFNEPTKEL
ncbi:MAG: hypothetical protein K6G17_00600 [Oscillospiraceae bacterium]|nr:hypothetical protein [Oscillospiraceae bacterium]